jgi:hypothetical protein
MSYLLLLFVILQCISALQSCTPNSFPSCCYGMCMYDNFYQRFICPRQVFGDAEGLAADEAGTEAPAADAVTSA